MGSLVHGRLNLTRPVYLHGLQFQILDKIIVTWLGRGGGIGYYNTSEASDTSRRILKFRTGEILVMLIYIQMP